ncbi:DNA-binding protein [Serratia fonticola]|uniref:integrase domain-containing protein n=1 Tax=Serratia fonticola TaxID=47917 RepID=UPI0008FD323B|nr:DNA-binding protein [Serratia fonticola]QCR62992.1 DNA-binding protein [Serratia fonticola]
MEEIMARSKVEIFENTFVTLARRAGGGYKTIAEKTRIAQTFLDYLKTSGIKLRQVQSVKTKYIESYIAHRREAGIKIRTLQNEMSTFRSIYREAGMHKLADTNNSRLSNKALGLSGASRDGNKIALSHERFLEAFAKIEKKDVGVAAAMQLSYYLGLRNKEAIQSVKSLSTWKSAIERGDKTLRVVFGTKGGRPRDTTIIQRGDVIRAINYALKFSSENNNKLVDRPSMHSAMDRYRNVLRRDGGLAHENSPHSLRYSYAQASTLFHQAGGMSKEEATAMTSMDLGHGDGRGRYVERVYHQGGLE